MALFANSSARLFISRGMWRIAKEESNASTNACASSHFGPIFGLLTCAQQQWSVSMRVMYDSVKRHAYLSRSCSQTCGYCRFYPFGATMCRHSVDITRIVAEPCMILGDSMVLTSYIQVYLPSSAVKVPRGRLFFRLNF